MSITLQTEGRRTYITGNTYPVRDRLRALGAHWDGERKAWWTAKRDAAEQLVGQLNAQPAADQPKTERQESSGQPYEGEVRGQVEYRGRQYYVRWAGRTSRGTDACRLVTRDGKVDCWADAAECRWTKRYEQRGAYGKVDERYGSYPTLAGIQRFIARDQRETKETGIDCWMCRREAARGNLRMHLHDGCEACGAEG